MTHKKKLIEVALPLEAINKESAREKSIRHGHPSTLHLWWSRKPLATCRAVLFSSLVDDPSSHPDKFPTEEAQEQERQRLFRILEDLVKWENTTNEEVLDRAREEILKSTDGNPPPVLDPFCGGGSIPLEAQRLGLEAHASDLNPVAVLITKALIEIPPKFAGKPPVHPDQDRELTERKWKGVEGLAEDVRYYGEWMRNEAEKRIGHLYPKVTVTPEMAEERKDLAPYVGRDLTAIAWLWARTVKCPNPACGAEMPLVLSFWLSKKKGKQAWVEPVVDHEEKTVRFEVRVGDGEVPEGTVNRRGAHCIVCGEPVPFDHVRSEGRAKRIGARLMAIVVEGDRGRLYFEPNPEHEETASKACPSWAPKTNLPEKALGFRVQAYGMTKHRDLFTNRQLAVLAIFCELLTEVRDRVCQDAVSDDLSVSKVSLADGGSGTQAYGDAVSVYLALAMDKGLNLWANLTTWMGDRGALREVFARQTVSMTWGSAEANPFSSSGGGFKQILQRIVDVTHVLPATGRAATSRISDAGYGIFPVASCLVSTDPPYYSNIGYADLADFFYVWLRHGLRKVFPDLFTTLLTPKSEELVANPYRFEGGAEEAKEYYEQGMLQAFAELSRVQDANYPLVIFYAFKQAESESNGDTVSTGWETMLEALLQSGLAITGTWPMRTESPGRARAQQSNALASSIVLACRPHSKTSQRTTRSGFLSALKQELPPAIQMLKGGNIAPVDLYQAAIGPGMAVFSRYREVLEADGSPMTVRTALALINQTLDEILSEQEADYDPDTRWALPWFEQHGFNEAAFGEAETLSKAKNTSVQGLVDAGILRSGEGKVRLLNTGELPADWDPSADSRLTVWEITHHMVRVLGTEGESAAADILRDVGPMADAARDLAYRLYQVCERKGWAREALGYNALAIAWPEIKRLAAEAPRTTQEQQGFDFDRG